MRIDESLFAQRVEVMFLAWADIPEYTVLDDHPSSGYLNVVVLCDLL